MNTRLNPYPTQNFQARQIAKAYIKGGKAKQCIELYALDSSDKNFVTNLMRIKIKIAPNINPSEKFNISFKPTLMERLKTICSKLS